MDGGILKAALIDRPSSAMTSNPLVVGRLGMMKDDGWNDVVVVVVTGKWVSEFRGDGDAVVVNRQVISLQVNSVIVIYCQSSLTDRQRRHRLSFSLPVSRFVRSIHTSLKDNWHQILTFSLYSFHCYYILFYYFGVISSAKKNHKNLPRKLVMTLGKSKLSYCDDEYLICATLIV